MGSLWSRLFRSKPDTKRLLELIQDEIEDIEDYRYNSSKRERNTILSIGFFFVLIYLVLTAVIVGFYWVPLTGWHVFIDRRFWGCISPIIVLPIIFYLIRRGLQFYYIWVRDGKEIRLRELKKQKRKILDRVMETETYRNAEEILRRFDPNSLRQHQTPGPPNSPLRMPQNTPQLRYRGNVTPNPGSLRALMPGPSSFTPQNNTSFRPQMNFGSVRAPLMTPQRPSMTPMAPMTAQNSWPRTIKSFPSQNRSVSDKLVDWLVNDGPNKRYALICIHCYSHNGVALKDEFEYLAFRCAFCRQFNPSRKTKPLPPRLNPTDLNKRSSLGPLIDEPESDTDSERGRLTIDESTRFTEIHDQTDSDKPNVIQKEKNNENVGTSNEMNESVAETSKVSEETKTNEKRETNAEDIEHDTNKKEEKDIPFIDDSSL